MFQTQRRWDEMQDLRKEAKGWIADLDARETALKADCSTCSKERKAEVEAVLAAEEERRRRKSATPSEAKPRRQARQRRRRTEEACSRQKPKTIAQKQPGDEKPSDPPKDLSPAKAAKTDGQGGRNRRAGEEAGDKGKTPGARPRRQRPSSATRTASDEKAAATVEVVDFSPLAENHAASGPFARQIGIPWPGSRSSNWPSC